MRYTPLVLAMTCIGAAPSMAAAQLSLGVKGGFSYDNVSNKGVLPGNLGSRSGLAAGVAASTGGLLGIGIEALYAQRGVTSATAADERHLDYVDVPAYLRVTLPLPLLAPFAYAGPQASFELRCRAGTVDCPDTGRPTTTYAGVLGAGVRLGASPGITIEARWMQGFTDLQLSTVTNLDNYSYYHRSLMILGGLSF